MWTGFKEGIHSIYKHLCWGLFVTTQRQSDSRPQNCLGYANGKMWRKVTSICWIESKFSFLVLTRCWCLEHCGKWWSYICICSPCSLIFEYLYRNYSARFTNYNWRIIPAMIIGGDYCMFLKYLPFHLFDVRCLSCLQFVIFAFHQFAYLLFTFWLFIFDLFDRLLWPN